MQTSDSTHRRRVVIRADTGNWAIQSALDRYGLGPVAGVDEAGRGACAGPLVVAACVLRPGDSRKFPGLTDSKLLTEIARERMYDLILAKAADFSVVVIPPSEVDTLGIHVVNIEGMRRAVAQLSVHPGYVLTDGFGVPGLTAPSMSVPKGDQAIACVAAASALAKVTRDRIMAELHTGLPHYGFAKHKGYCTAEHSAALEVHGPSAHHRWSYANVIAAASRHGLTYPAARGGKPQGVVQNDTNPHAGKSDSRRERARIP